PDATLDQKIATGFNRCLPTTGEGGAISEEYEAIYAKDRVETVSTVWLGLTTGCAACHDHKFDPIGTADFYALTAFFRNTTMSAMDGNSAEHPPNIFAPVPADRERWSELTEIHDRIQSDLAKRKSEAAADFEKWLVTAKDQSITRVTPDSSLAIHIPFDSSDATVKGISDGQPIEWNLSGEHREGPFGPALLANSVTSDLGPLGAFSRTDQVSYGFHVFVEGKPKGAIISKFEGGKDQRGWDISIKEGKIAAHVIDSWPDAANKITAKEELKPDEWHHVFVTFDGSRASHQTMKVYIDGKAVPGGPEPNTLGGDITSNTPLRIGSRNDGSEKLEGTVAIQDFRFYRRLLSPEEIKTLSEQNELQHFLSIPSAKRTKEQTATLLDHFLATEDPRSLELLRELDGIRAPRDEIKQRGSLSLIMTEKKDQPAEAHVLERGIYSSKGAKVSANVPVSLPPLGEDAPHDRLGLAKWLVSKDNPLTARVTVNRAWQQFFGTGIVESSGDFGIMGSRPSHPALLDWLAIEFMDSGWDYRHILKLIVTSETYRQSAAISPEKLERDPYNKLLARGPRQRLDAEVIRDLALSSSDLLSQKTGGPPVKPYQPEGIWEAVAMPQSNTRKYKEDSGENLYRRSLYTFWKRTAPPPSMEILNAPSREVSCVRRDQTNTPLQALVLLNDPQFVEACKQLAARALKSSEQANARLDFITKRLLNRTFDASERKIITDSLTEISNTFLKEPEAAVSYLETGATPRDPSIPAPELATWTAITSQILNLDETLTR
ncbi:MAG TPA: DUF1553 domain-containing protein, partial [Luteolibacter sp.]|nr:DUF1553 domain-containing protein [Luteolibacter sp.]